MRICVHILSDLDGYKELIAGRKSPVEWFLMIGYDRMINPSWVKIKGVILHWGRAEFRIKTRKIRLKRGYFWDLRIAKRYDETKMIRLNKHRIFDATGRIYYYPDTEELIITYSHEGMEKYRIIRLRKFAVKVGVPWFGSV